VSYSGGSGAQPSALAMAAAGAGEAEGYAEEEITAMPVVEQRHVDPSEQIGRNDPCWCGSGKKFKKCHGA
jgi:preprotein translocase subunit SecA